MPDFYLVKRNDAPNSYSLSEYILRSADRVSSLPTSTQTGADGEPTCYPGSVAYTGDLEHIYILSPDDTWKEV